MIESDINADQTSPRKSPSNPDKMRAFFFAAEIAMKTVFRAAAAGNVQCKEAEERMKPYLDIMKKP